MVRDYIASHGSSCPYCGSAEIGAGKVEADGDSAWSRVTCDDCGKAWQDVFFLGAIDILDANGSYSDTIMPACEHLDGAVIVDAAAPPAT
jgi:hypothetical protein